MKANELRIGNYVIHELKRYRHVNFYEVYGILDDVIDVYPSIGNSDFVSINEIKPIPLTEQWLINFGFQVSEYEKNTFILNDININLSYNIFNKTLDHLSLNIGGQYNWTMLLDNLYYVHQLQNLYFALTGEELALKSNPKSQ